MSSVDFSPKCINNSKGTFPGFYCMSHPVVVKLFCTFYLVVGSGC